MGYAGALFIQSSNVLAWRVGVQLRFQIAEEFLDPI